MRPRTLVAVVLCLAMLTSLGGCSLIPQSSGDRQMTVYFAKARSFYPDSKVKIMGADVGIVDTVEQQGDRIKVRFSIRGDVPLPRGVHASIMPFNLISERNLVLHPAWKPGQPKETSNTIPLERTSVPVEVDDALESFTEIADALDPTKVRGSLGRAADSFEGNGQAFNRSLEQAGVLTQNIASQDRELLKVARNLNRLAGVVRGREEVLGSMIRDFGTVAEVLGAERRQLQQLVRDLLVLVRGGGKLIKKYRDRLPEDLAILTRMALMLQGNSKQLALLVEALPGVGDAIVNGYNKDMEALAIRFATDAFLRTWLKGIENSDDVGCPLPAPNSNCPWDDGGAG